MSTDGILYVQFNPERHPQLIPGLVDCYRKVFAAGPWNEWKKCSRCGKKWGTSEMPELAQEGFLHCGQPVEDFWPVDVVTNDIRHEVTDVASCWLAMTRSGVIGFIWGYAISPDSLATKLGLPDIPRVLHERFGHQKMVAYQDEVGVLEEFRGRKIAKELAAHRLRDLKAQGLKVGVVRTKTNPPSVTYLWYKRDGFDTVAEYGDNDGRVVLARPYDDYHIT